MTTSSQTAGVDSNASLLEGLYQLAVAGQTGTGEFDLIEQEVYTRLLAAYQSCGNAVLQPAQ